MNRATKGNSMSFVIRPAAEQDAWELSRLRLHADGETENLDREPGENVLDADAFAHLIVEDAKNARNLFLVAEVDGKLAGFSRCQGSDLQRSMHKVEFGVMVLQQYWGLGIGRGLLRESINWADANSITKMTLNVIDSNRNAIKLYESMGFSIEGVLKNDKLLSGGRYCDTIVMGRINPV